MPKLETLRLRTIGERMIEASSKLTTAGLDNRQIRMLNNSIRKVGKEFGNNIEIRTR